MSVGAYGSIRDRNVSHVVLCYRTLSYGIGRNVDGADERPGRMQEAPGASTRLHWSHLQVPQVPVPYEGSGGGQGAEKVQKQSGGAVAQRKYLKWCQQNVATLI